MRKTGKLFPEISIFLVFFCKKIMQPVLCIIIELIANWEGRFGMKKSTDYDGTLKI